MAAITKTEHVEQEKIVDNLSEEIENKIIADKMAMLKAKAKSKEEKPVQVKKERSLEFGIIGSGQAGSNLANCWHSEFGYPAIAINTALQDLKGLNLPDSNKLLLEGTLGGASKELSIGANAAESNRSQILELVNDKLAASQINIFCTSFSGGSGAGSVETIISVLMEIGKPIIVIGILPLSNEDVHAKSNALETLAKLSNMVKTNKIQNLFVVDNLRLEAIYSDISQFDFFNVANKAIIEPLDAFNRLSAMPSSVKGIDNSELAKLLVDSNGISVFGQINCNSYKEDTALAEAVLKNLSNNLLSEGFDIKESKYVGVIFAANKKVWDSIPASSTNYAISLVNEACGSPKALFKGIYETDSDEDNVKVYTIFAGLSLPATRVDSLREDVKKGQQTLKQKDEQRNLNLTLDTGTTSNVSAAQAIKDKIAQKSSAFGKMMSSTSDRRK